MASSKKTILFVNESLACAGGEKSLLNLLATLDYDKYEVYLQLFKYGCEWDKYIDPRVNVLPPLPYTEFTNLPLSKAVLYAIRHCKIKWLWARLRYSAMLRRKSALFNIQKSCLYWKAQSACFENIKDKFDYVIAYAQGIPTFYVTDKVVSESKKIGWINATYLPDEPEKRYIETKYERMDTVVAVSEGIMDIETEHFPSFQNKIKYFRDLINPDTIVRLSQEKADLPKKENGELTLVTLGRLSPGKGYDIAIEAAAKLKQSGIQFKWYVLGVGALEKELRQEVERYGLNDRFIFLGVKGNPYPYLKMADIYVQTSRLEGFGLAIAEARILNIPVVTTRFNNVYMQMVDGKNGLVTDMNGEAVAQAIMRLNSDTELYASIVEYLKKEKKGNLETIQSLYKEILN